MVEPMVVDDVVNLVNAVGCQWCAKLMVVNLVTNAS